jgi:hypothetical protein
MVTPSTAATQNVRSILGALGIGEFNATMIIPYMFIPPATTDPGMAQIILLTTHIQDVLGLPVTGQIDEVTAEALRNLIGRGWTRVSWNEIAQAALAARVGFRPPLPSRSRAQAVGDLPDVTSVGGIATLAVFAVGAWWLLKKGR